MADPLTLLRQYHTNGKTEDILESDNHIVFGDLAWPKDVRTNFRIYGSETDGKWDYYTLECLLYFLKNIKRSHPDYVKQARGEVPIVHRPDRRDLIGYLEGTLQKKDLKSIDASAPLQMPTNNFRRSLPSSGATSASAQAADVISSQDSVPAAKKPRLDAGGSGASGSGSGASAQSGLKERLVAKLDMESGEGKHSKAIKHLSDDLTTDKIAEIRAKLLSKRRTRIKPEDEEGAVKSVPSLGLADIDASRETRELFSRERVWRTRTTILQSSGKNFSKTVTAILASVKAREEGHRGGHHAAPTSSHMPPPPSRSVPSVGIGPGLVIPQSSIGQAPMAASQPQQQNPRSNYDRYGQEQFRRKDDTHGFNIETTETFSGMTLKSVTEGNQQAANRSKPQHPSARGPSSLPNAMSNSAAKPGASPGALASNNNQAGKRPSRTPIIIIPAAPKSLITMYNAKEILQDLRFVSTEEKKGGGLKRENELLITRRKDGGLTVPYRVIDNPAKLTNADWDRVVAVFVMGQAWQFKGWPYEGNPTVIFSKIAAFHVKWDEAILEKNVANWAVNIIQLSREKRHLDRARIMTFWETLDKYMVSNKPHLRF